MPGRIVNCTHLDSVRIEILGEGRAVTIPAALILAADRVFRSCLAREEELDVVMVEDDETKRQGWQAHLDMGAGPVGEMADTPWSSILALAEELEK